MHFGAAIAHDAKSGWAYPFSCCSGYDCRQVPASAIDETQDGIIIKGTGETIPYNDERHHESPDGAYHWCSQAGANDTPTICIFTPPKGA